VAFSTSVSLVRSLMAFICPKPTSERNARRCSPLPFFWPGWLVSSFPLTLYEFHCFYGFFGFFAARVVLSRSFAFAFTGEEGHELDFFFCGGSVGGGSASIHTFPCGPCWLKSRSVFSSARPELAWCQHQRCASRRALLTSD